MASKEALKKFISASGVFCNMRMNCSTSLQQNAQMIFEGFHLNQPQRYGFESPRFVSTSCLKLAPDDKDGISNDEELKSNPFYEKYADKIEKTKTERSRKPVSLEQISSRMKYEAKKVRKQMDTLHQKMDGKAETLSSSKSANPPSLDKILKLEQLVDKTGEEIGQIWTNFYKDKNVLCAAIPGKIYSRINSRALSCPTFIYPLVKEQGYEFILGQFTDDQCFFTSLLNYQTHGENAPWQMKLTHFTELQDEKDIVLMLGEIDENTLNVLEAQCLAQQLQMFYATSDEERFNLVTIFNKTPDKFKYMDVIREIEASRLIESYNTRK